jgi:hypothetical protein
MLPLFTYPLAFLGLLAIPWLVIIYWLRNRFRRYPVSSLMLWLDPRVPREGGLKIQRLQTPLLFFLEVLAVLFLTMAASDPKVQTSFGTRPLIVVLDDSYSMQAGAAQSPRMRGLKAVEEELRSHTHYSIRFLLAGERPQALGEVVHSVGEALEQLKNWSCRAPSACLEETLSLASELGGERGQLLVVTDHAPPREGPGAIPEKGRIQWWSFGMSRPNLAIVNAARTERDGAERCLLEVVNLAEEPQTANLVVEAGDPPVEIQRSPVRLGPKQLHREVLQLKEGTLVVRARLDPDELDIDNQVSLLPVPSKRVRVDIAIADARMKALVEKAVGSIRGVVRTAVRPGILFTDQDSAVSPDATIWRVHLLVEKDAAAYTGPFVIDKAHPLTEGLSLQGVVWGAGKTSELLGSPILMAGGIPLLTDMESLSGRHDLRLRLRPDLSTLQDSPGWPVLIANLVQWRATLMPGLSRANIRLGEETTLMLSRDQESVRLIGPDQKQRVIPVQGKHVVVRPDEVGVYEIQSEEEPHRFAANALSREESDLTGCETGHWGDWLDETSLRLEYQSIGWIFILLLLVVLTLHLYFVSHRARRAAP